MKKRLISLFLTLFVLTGCSPAAPAGSGEEDVITIVTTTYPVYLFAAAVTEGVEGVVVERLDTGSTGCLHDYTLSVNDMKKLEKADVIALSGAGLEEFMEDALATSSAAVIDCSEGVELLENASHHHDEHDHGHDGHDHGHFDPHYWMDPENAAQMVTNLVDGMRDVDAVSAEQYFQNGLTAHALLFAWESNLQDLLAETRHEISGLITFHDGFQYFAHAYDLPLLRSIEEEAGSEASAKEITEIAALVKEHDIPVIFTEVNGSEATAKAIARETGCQIAQLSMIMDGPDGEMGNYFDAMLKNMAAVINGFAEEEVVQIG